MSNDGATDIAELFIERRIPPLLRRAWYSLNQEFRRRLAHLQITPNQFTILRWLIEKDNQGLTQREIAYLMASDPNTITSILNRLEDKEYIERTPHESDKRAHRIRVKEGGREIYNQAKPIAMDLQDEISHCIAPDKVDEFITQLSTLADNCNKILNKNK